MKRVAPFLCALVFASLLVAPASAQQDKKVEKKADEKSQVSAEFMNDVWKNVNKLTKEKRSFEVEKATTVAGVRGKEAEDEALSKLYFKGGENYPSRVELQQAVKALTEQLKENPKSEGAAEIKYYIAQCHIQLGEKDQAAKMYDRIISENSKTKWADLAREGKKELGG